MRWLFYSTTVATLVALNAPLMADSRPASPNRTTTSNAIIKPKPQLRIPEQSDPLAVSAALRADDFGLISASWISGVGTPVGVTCFTPYRQAPKVKESFSTGDVVTPALGIKLNFARSYNVALVGRADYPDADICRPAIAGDGISNDDMLLAKAARTVEVPVHSLWEAARRSNATDIRKYLTTTSVDAVDGLGMTAIAWAAARGNLSAIDALLVAGANPWISEETARGGAVYWALATGHLEIFNRLKSINRPEYTLIWPRLYLAAALNSGNRALVETILATKHQKLLPQDIRSEVSIEALAPVLADGGPELAQEALFVAFSDMSGVRLDLVKLALQNHANPNVTRYKSYGETPLGLAAKGYPKDSDVAAKLLLEAGADINLPSPYVPVNPERPIWRTVKTLLLSRGPDEINARAIRTLKVFIAARADLTLPNIQGKPPIWFLLTPVLYAPEEINDWPNLPDILPILIQGGMDIGAKWKGRTILPLVERQLGPDSRLAIALRRLGAKRV